MLSGGTVFGQIVIVAASPLLTRLYSPSDLGAYGVYASIIGVLVVVACLGYELAITLPSSERSALNLLVLSLAVAALFCLAVGVVLVFIGPWLVSLLGVPDLRPYIWLIPVGLFAGATYNALTYWAVRQHAFRTVARTKVGQSLGQVSIQLGLGALSLAPAGLLIGHAFGQGGGSGRLAALALRVRAQLPPADSGDRFIRLAKRYQRFPLFSTFSALLNSLGLYLPLFLLASFYGPEVLGWFALTQRVLATPMRLFGQMVSQVYFSELARRRRENPNTLVALFAKTTKGLVLIGALPALVFAVAAPWLFATVFGPEWREAGHFAQLLSGTLLIQFVTSPVGQSLIVLERQGLQLAWNGGRLLAVTGAIVGGSVAGLGPRGSVALYAITLFLAYGVLFMMCRKVLQGPLKEPV